MLHTSRRPTPAATPRRMALARAGLQLGRLAAACQKGLPGSWHHEKTPLTLSLGRLRAAKKALWRLFASLCRLPGATSAAHRRLSAPWAASLKGEGGSIEPTVASTQSPIKVSPSRALWLWRSRNFSPLNAYLWQVT